MKRMLSVHHAKAFALLFAALVCLSFTVMHHGWADYDQSKTLNLKGQIQQFSYESPHGMIKFKVGKKIWNVVLAPPSRMESRGLAKEMLKEETAATVVGYPHRKVKDEMRAERITIGGKTTELR